MIAGRAGARTAGRAGFTAGALAGLTAGTEAGTEAGFEAETEAVAASAAARVWPAAGAAAIPDPPISTAASIAKPRRRPPAMPFPTDPSVCSIVIPLNPPIRIHPDTVPVKRPTFAYLTPTSLSHRPRSGTASRFRLPSAPMPRARSTRFLALLTLLTPLTGCAGLGPGAFSGSAGSGEVVSESLSTRLNLDLPTRVAIVHDHNTAEVYLTDLSPATLARLAEGRITPDISGTILAVRIFLNPKPGRTPIAQTAASATARLVVIARGQIGVYDGAGFIMPGRSLRKGFAAGTLRNAPTRLTRATPGFQDLLASARLEVSFRAPEDEPAAERLAAVVRTLALAAEPITNDPDRGPDPDPE
jgi:hypothetical protein